MFSCTETITLKHLPSYTITANICLYCKSNTNKYCPQCEPHCCYLLSPSTLDTAVLKLALQSCCHFLPLHTCWMWQHQYGKITNRSSRAYLPELPYKLQTTAVKNKSLDTQKHSGARFCTNISQRRIISTARVMNRQKN